MKHEHVEHVNWLVQDTVGEWFGVGLEGDRCIAAVTVVAGSVSVQYLRQRRREAHGGNEEGKRCWVRMYVRVVLTCVV